MSMEEAKAKVAAAERACEKALDAWRAAIQALGTDVSVNGYGILHDRAAFQQRLRAAQQHIAESLESLSHVDWPGEQDYDRL